MVRHPKIRVISAAATAVLLAGYLPAHAHADPVLVFPGMEIHQGARLCTLGYVDPDRRLAFTAGHCWGNGPVTDKDNNVIGKLGTFRNNMPTGTLITSNQPIADYESIVLAPDVAVNNILPGGQVLVSDPGLVVTPGEPVCHFGVITGESCGTVESVDNGWFTMGDGIVSQRGDSGGPVYTTGPFGPTRIVGIFNAIWGPFPIAVSWQSTTQHIREDVRVGGPSI
jgi:hypothetical protein